jgi:multicomponent Na+:H+ antiporter subunit B
MTSLLVQAAARIVTPLLLVISVLLLLRGHNEPGGGFIGGLVCGCAYVLWGIAFGMPAALRLLRISPRQLMGGGLFVASASAIPALFAGLPIFTGLWPSWSIPTGIVGNVKLGTPLFFDIGIYMVVAGTVVIMVLAMSEDEGKDRA